MADMKKERKEELDRLIEKTVKELSKPEVQEQTRVALEEAEENRRRLMREREIVAYPWCVRDEWLRIAKGYYLL